MTDLTNSIKYNINDLTSFAIIVNKAYNVDSQSLIYYKNIEKNLKIEALLINKKEISKEENKVTYYKNDETDAEFYSFEYNDTLIYSFTGTNSEEDWEHSFKICLETVFIGGKFCKIHKGFYEQYFSLRTKILDIYREYIYRNKKNSKVLILAHSLGSIGQIATIEMKEIYNDTNIDCITFGSPRMGDKIFVEMCNKCINENIRIVNDNDIVPCFPLDTHYRSIGKILLIKNEKAKYEERNIWTNIRIYILVLFSWIPFLKIHVITDHKIQNYINEISKLKTL